MNERLYKSLYTIRRVEEEIARVYPTDKIRSPVHLSIGQEAIAVGVCEALRATDYVFGSYRSHAMYLAKGGDLRGMIAELFGKATGIDGGKGGSMHLVDLTGGVMGASAVVATTIPQAVGYAYAVKVQCRDAVVACFFGDGATEEGAYYESLNFAALKNLPVLFICENNSYAIHTHQLRRQKEANIAERARTFGIAVERLPDDVVEIYAKVSAAVSSMRRHAGGPVFFECLTYRWREHVGPNTDFELGYRSADEAAPWIANDQVKRMAELLTQAQRERIETQVEAQIRSAFAYAEESPFPETDQLLKHVWKE